MAKLWPNVFAQRSSEIPNNRNSECLLAGISVLLGSFSADTITFCYADWCSIAVSTLGICIMMRDQTM